MEGIPEILLDRGWAMWLAGVMDCEGSFQIRKKSDVSFQPVLEIKMSTRAVLDRVVAITGVGRVFPKPSVVGTNARDGFRWRAGDVSAALITAAIQPYLLEKPRQGLLIQALAASRHRYGFRLQAADPNERDRIQQYRNGLRTAMNILNLRGRDTAGQDLDDLTFQALIGGPDAYMAHLVQNPQPSYHSLDGALMVP